MAFSGPAPETVNGRLAMLGFAAALGAELSTGEPVVQQLSDAPAAILAVFVAFAIASLVPILKGANLKESLGPFTPAVRPLMLCSTQRRAMFCKHFGQKHPTFSWFADAYN